MQSEVRLDREEDKAENNEESSRYNRRRLDSRVRIRAARVK